jgi:hypothetical protein
LPALAMGAPNSPAAASAGLVNLAISPVGYFGVSFGRLPDQPRFQR